MTRSKVGEVSLQVIALETNGWVPNTRRLPVSAGQGTVSRLSERPDLHVV